MCTSDTRIVVATNSTRVLPMCGGVATNSTCVSGAPRSQVIAGRLELLLLRLFIVLHGKVVTHSGVATNSQTVHDVSAVLHAVASCALGTIKERTFKGSSKTSRKKEQPRN